VFTDCLAALSSSGDLDTFRVTLCEKEMGQHIFHQANVLVIIVQQKYAHSMVTPTIVAPGMNKVISLPPSFITPHDGDSKQDCGLKASKRWLGNSLRESVTILGDEKTGLTERSIRYTPANMQFH
jgi:hypothetical protein